MQKPAPAGEVRDLRELLAAVVEALTLPFDAPGYEQRIVERACVARVVLRDVLDEGADRIGWNADWLRGKLREEEAAHRGGDES